LTGRIVYRPGALDYGAFSKIEPDCFPDEPLDTRAFAEALKQDFWAVFDGEEFAGYGCVVLKQEFAWITRIGVGARWRRRGIGRSLMETMIGHCRKHGHKRVLLYVLQDNSPAIRLYREFDFRERETSYQYVVPIRRFLNSGRQSEGGPMNAVPIDKVNAGDLPAFPDQWADIASMHHPPENYVLIFRTGERHAAGYCRLSPGFPGCFPFVIESPGTGRLAGILGSLEQYLNKEEEILKLTFPGHALAEACEQLGFRLNYRLFRMERSL
jgi:ribosomal-protein-alanine N-acetyltransferase